MTTIDIFKPNANFNQYVSEGGDINVFHPETGESLFHFLCNRICTSFDNGFFNPPIKLLTFKDYHLENSLKTQDRLYSIISINFKSFDIHDGKYDYETFINRFDLNHHIGYIKKIPGLHFFLSRYQNMSFFHYAKDLHKDFYDNLKTTCPNGNNLWHFLLGTLALIPHKKNHHPYCLESFSPHCVELGFETIKFLFSHFPEGLEQKNNRGLTPLESIICNTSKHFYYDYFELIDHQYTQKERVVGLIKEMESFIDLGKKLNNNFVAKNVVKL